MRAARTALVVASLLVAGGSRAQIRGQKSPPPRLDPPRMVGPSAQPRNDVPTALRGRFGVDLAQRLERSDDAEERLRAVVRAGALGTSDAVAMLVAELDATQTIRGDARVKIEIARGLAAHADLPSARSALFALVNMGNAPATRGGSDTTADPFGGDAQHTARLELARRIAAIALAQALGGINDPKLADALLSAVRAGGSGSAAAANALAAFPPAFLPIGTTVMTPPLVRLLASLGDLRTLDAVRAATRANDAATRAAAIIAMGQLGDGRGIEIAQAALGESDPRIRAAAGEALVALGAPSRNAAVEALLGDDATAAAGIRLAEYTHDDAIVRALATRTVNASDPATREAAVEAIGRAPGDEAVRALVALSADELLRGDAANALAQSPSDGAMAAIETMAEANDTRHLGVRAYVARIALRGDRPRSRRVERVVEQLERSSDGADRALAAFAQIALGDGDLARSLDDRDPRVRRAAATASLARSDAKTRRMLLARLAGETDATTRIALAAGLVDGDPDGRSTTSKLLERAESGAPDAPLAAMAFARNASDAQMDKVDALFTTRDAVLRAHVARGLGASASPDAIGRLAAAYRYETDTTVRRALVVALASRASPAPSRTDTLRLAAQLDPEASIRWIAARALRAGADAALAEPATGRGVAWIRLISSIGSRAGDANATPFTGALVRSDGLAVPFAFDADGYALVLGMPPGPSRLVLAPQLPEAYTNISP